MEEPTKQDQAVDLRIAGYTYPQCTPAGESARALGRR